LRGRGQGPCCQIAARCAIVAYPLCCPNPYCGYSRSATSINRSRVTLATIDRRRRAGRVPVTRDRVSLGASQPPPARRSRSVPVPARWHARPEPAPSRPEWPPECWIRSMAGASTSATAIAAATRTITREQPLPLLRQQELGVVESIDPRGRRPKHHRARHYRAREGSAAGLIYADDAGETAPPGGHLERVGGALPRQARLIPVSTPLRLARPRPAPG
jgi:hypothetical protein